jgi:hypothetical protein
MEEHQLWSFNTALFVLILFIVIAFVVVFGTNRLFDIKNIKNNWAEQRCKPFIMPFAGLFGYDSKENFEFCMGKIFSTHSMPALGSMGGMLTQFTGLLGSVFDSISSLRNVIASIGGGINVVFQEFTERISSFFFNLRVSAIRIKTLIGRMYAILFSVMYMALSGITGVTTFTNTFLFSFLDIFCFPGNTRINIKGKGKIEIKDIKIGDVIEPSGSKVTATFCFYSKGQPMVKLGTTTVSTNHYVKYLGHSIKAKDHPDAIKLGFWNSEEPLYCLNTSDNRILIDGIEYLDYDETNEGDKDTMNDIQSRLNAENANNNKNKDEARDYTFKEYGAAISENTIVQMKNGIKKAKDIKIGDKLSTGSEVVGLIRKNVKEICEISNDKIITPSTLYWNKVLNKWERIGERVSFIEKEMELLSFVVVPNSQIELENDLRIRDYVELCSPDSEIHYSKCLESLKI